jgi:hypothetical protein
MNFGESLAYWYFRLNGFFPLTNFVLHRHAEVESDADADLLAIRFSHVSEPIGGQPDDWDNETFDSWALGHREQTVCIICDVKTARHDRASIARSFDPLRLTLAIQRFGVLDRREVDGVVSDLCEASAVRRHRITFAKVLMARRFGPSVRDAPCFRLQLQEAIAFIENRMKRYRSEKTAARMLFPGDLIQFFAWKAGLAIGDTQPESVEE